MDAAPLTSDLAQDAHAAFHAAHGSASFICAECGKLSPRKPSHVWRVTCSMTCAAKRKTKQRSAICGCCRQAFKPSKTNQKYCSVPCSKKGSATTRLEMGLRPDHGEEWARAMKSEKHRNICSVAHKGKKMKTPKTARHSAMHHKALCFFVKSPRNTTHIVINVRKFIVDNESMFPPETVIWRKHKGGEICRAATGLYSIASGKRGVWRGWMKVGNLEGKENTDLLPRTFLEQNKQI